MAILRCTEPFAADGVIVTMGQLIDSGHPVVKGREHLFEPVETFVSRRSGSETATAAPGEARTVKRATRK